MEAGGCSLRGLQAAGSARCPGWRGEEARPRWPCAGQLGRGKDSAPGRRCAVPARQPARVRSGPGRGSPEKPRRGRVRRPPARRGAPETPRDRARGRAAARVGPGRGVPQRCRRRRSAAGPCVLRRPLARGRRTGAGVGASREEGRGSPRRAPAARPRSGAPWRGGGEAGKTPRLLPPGVPRVTAAAAILPHTDPPPGAR